MIVVEATTVRGCTPLIIRVISEASTTASGKLLRIYDFTGSFEAEMMITVS